MYNDTQITFTGRLGADVEIHDVTGGRQVATFRVATRTSRFRDGEWVDGPTTWHTVKAWNRLATHVAESLRCGDPVLVHGKLTCDVWTREDGSTTSRFVVVASSVGHDLALGTSVFTKPVPAAAGQVPGIAA